jgi:hypothetical protein
MDDGERTIEIERLLKEHSEARTRKNRLLAEMEHFVARIHEIRAAFGNPFFYSHPKSADEGISNYSGFGSHDVMFPTAIGLRRVNRELRRISEQLRGLVRLCHFVDSQRKSRVI